MACWHVLVAKSLVTQVPADKYRKDKNEQYFANKDNKSNRSACNDAGKLEKRDLRFYGTVVTFSS